MERRRREGEIRFAQAVRIGDLIYVAGQVAWDKDGEIVGKGDLLAQSRQVFKNISESWIWPALP